MADNEIDPGEVFDECNERLDLMVNSLVTIARKQGALVLGPRDLIKMKNAFNQQINTFMMPFLAASAVVKLVNQELAAGAGIPNT